MPARLILIISLALLWALLPGVAHADPVTGAIVTFVAVNFGATAAAVASFVINAAISVGVSALASKLGKQKSANAERQAQATTLSLGEVPREVIFGTARVGGSLVDIFNFGGKYGTDTVTWCVALADHAIDGIEGYYVDDQYYPWTGEGLQAAFSNKLSFHFRNANPEGYDPPEHVRLNSDWTNADRLCAVTHMWIDARYDDKVWTQGLPKISFVLRGLKVFDARHDVRFGYTGDQPQTWEDRASHRFSINPIVQRYAYARGIYVEGHQGEAEHLLIGRGLGEAAAPPARVHAPANVCDEMVGSRRRYVTSGIVSSDMDFISVEERFAAATAGVIVQREGGVEIEPGQAKPALITITDGDLVTGEPVKFRRFRTDADGARINSVIPRYVSPAQGFKDHSGPVRRDLADIATDGGPRETTLALTLVTVAEQADDIAEIIRLLGRMERSASIVLPPIYAAIEEGDWIAWTSQRRHGGATVIYRVESWSLDAQWRMRPNLKEISATAFGEVDVIIDPTPAPPVVISPDALALDDVEIIPIVLTGEDGAAMPALRFAWSVAGHDVLAVQAEVRSIGAASAITRSDDVAAGELIVSNGVIPGGSVEARLLPIGNAARLVEDVAWVTVQTGPLVAGGIAPTNPIWGQLGDQTRQMLRTAIEGASAVIEEERRRMGDVDDVHHRLNLGMLLDPVTGDAIILPAMKAQGIGPGGLDETLIQTATRLAAADAANEAYSALVLSLATAHADEIAAEAALTYATQVAMAAGLAATLISAQSYTDAYSTTAGLTFATKSERETGDASTLIAAQSYTDDLETWAGLTLATKSERASGDASTLITAQSYADAAAAAAVVGLATSAALASALATAQGQWESYATATVASAIVGLASTASMNAAIADSAATLQSWTTGQIATAVAGLVTTAALATALSTAQGQWQSYADAAAASAIIGLVSTAMLASSLSTAQGQWEAYATAAAASAVVGLVSAATLASSLATAQGQWESYATTAASNAIIGLDTVASREAAVAASALSLQSWVAANYASSAALLAVSTTLGTTTSTAYLALSTAQGNEAYAALLTDINNRMTGVRINGVDRVVDFLADYFKVTATGSAGINIDAVNGVLKLFDATDKTILRASGGIRLWSGPASVADGSITEDNGVLALGPGVTGGGRFNGVTLSGPFDSSETAASLGLSGSWADIAVVPSKILINGYFGFWPQFFRQGVGAYDSGPGLYRLAIEWRVVSTDQSAGDVEVLDSGNLSQSHPSNPSFGAVGFAPTLAAGASVAGTKSGNRRIALQARIAFGSSAAVTNRRLRGFYSA